MLNLIKAVYAKDVKLVEKLIKDGADVNYINMKDPNIPKKYCGLYNTALMFANVEIAEILLKNGAKPNLKDETNLTPLICSIVANDINMVKLLIKYKCDIKTDFGNGTPLEVAKSESTPEMIKLITNALKF